MSLLTDAQVNILLADFANVDAGGKLNVIGGNISYIGQNPQSGLSSAFAVVVSVTVPAKYVGSSYALTVELHDVTVGQIFALPGPDGKLQALRAQQAVTIPPIQFPPGSAVPDDAMQYNNMIMAFEGLPLPSGHSFEFRVQIDGQTRHWFKRFHVLAPAPGVVFGGPAGSPVIPGVGEYVVKTGTDDAAAGDEGDAEGTPPS